MKNKEITYNENSCRNYKTKQVINERRKTTLLV